MDWERVKELLDAVLDQPEPRREAFIEEHGGDEATREEVRSLLAAHGAGASFFDASKDAADLLFGPVIDPLIGESVGPYRVVDHLGEGGMGAVYLAKRDDGAFERHVAVKVIRPGMLDKRTIQRFHAERQILADLAHVGIAAVLDGGMLEDGRPYLVMEYVRGRPIDRYCDEEKLTVSERLRLFRKVCKPVRYAHWNLVVHRDLKPSNILVTDEGEVKLLDFGVAKILESEDRDVPVTRTGRYVMTPEYASPEQIRGEAVTTSADVFALGVLLYMLLCGRAPHDTDAGSLAGIARAIVDDDPEPPSAVAVDAPTAERRAARPGELAQQLRGDLDVILLKALRKEPERRYETVADLSDDIDRHLRHLPISARPDTLTYRASRFVRRRPVAAALVTTLTVTVLGFGILVSLQQRATARERDRARQEEAAAQQVTAFLASLFEASNPYDRGAEAASVEDLLREGTERLSELDAEPAIQSRMYNVLGRVYSQRGDLEQGGRLLRLALERAHAAHERPNRSVASVLDNLGWYLLTEGSYDEARARLDEGLAILDALDERDSALGGSLLSNLGLLHYELAEYAAAEEYLREAVAVMEGDDGTSEFTLSGAINNLAMALYGQERFDEAEAAYRHSLELKEGTGDQRRSQIAGTYNNLAQLLQQQGRLDEAIPMMESALRMRRDLLGDDHPRVATSLNGLGLMIAERGRMAEAEVMLREALRILRTQYGEDHTYFGACLFNLAFVLEMADRPAEAEAAYARALQVLRQALPDPHLRTSQARAALGRVRTELGRAADAEPLLRRGYAELRELAGPDHWRTAFAGVALGACLAEQGRADEARPLIVNGYRSLLEQRGDELRTRFAETVYRAFLERNPEASAT